MIYSVDGQFPKEETEKYRTKTRNYAWSERPAFTSSIDDSPPEPNEESTMPCLTGFQNFTDPNASKAKKRFWFLIYVCCLTLCVAQTGERLYYYLQYPKTMTLELRKTISWEYPDITICPFHAFRRGTIFKATKKLCKKRNITDCNDSQVYQLLDYGYNITHLWKITGENLQHIVHKCKYEANKSCKLSAFWRTETTVMGTCYTLSIADKIMHGGPRFGIEIILHNPKQADVGTLDHLKWKIFLHENNTVLEYASFTRSHVVYTNSRTVIMFWKKVYESANTPINPCVSNEEVKLCLAKCFDQFFLRKSNCKLPFMKTLDLPLCTTAEEFKNLYIIPVYLNSFQSNIASCQCGRPCHQISYDIQPDSKSENKNRGHNRIIIYPTQSEVEIIRERLAYSINSLFSDIGGALGLYLGVCILTILHVFKIFVKVSIQAMAKSFRRKKSKPTKNDCTKYKF